MSTAWGSLWVPSGGFTAEIYGHGTYVDYMVAAFVMIGVISNWYFEFRIDTSQNRTLAKADGPVNYSSNSSGALKCSVSANFPKAKGGFAYISLYEESGLVNVGMIMFNIE